jgi:hypothetical protein
VKSFRPPYGDCDDRVRAIATALGFRTVFWSDDSKDTSRLSATPPPAVISDWFSAQPGFISLQHDISPTTVEIAINALVDARETTLGSIPQPVSQCQGIAPSQWYKNVEVIPPTPVTPNTTETPGVEPGSSKPDETGAAGKILISVLFAAAGFFLIN